MRNRAHIISCLVFENGDSSRSSTLSTGCNQPLSLSPSLSLYISRSLSILCFLFFLRNQMRRLEPFPQPCFRLHEVSLTSQANFFAYYPRLLSICSSPGLKLRTSRNQPNLTRCYIANPIHRINNSCIFAVKRKLRHAHMVRQ